jgi:hypothetical protein
MDNHAFNAMFRQRKATLMSKQSKNKNVNESVVQILQEDEEDLYEEVVISYDEQKKILFKNIMSFIDDFSAHQDRTVFVLMLKNLGQLS